MRMRQWPRDHVVFKLVLALKQADLWPECIITGRGGTAVCSMGAAGRTRMPVWESHEWVSLCHSEGVRAAEKEHSHSAVRWVRGHPEMR